jgi:hypothetical protein
MLCGSLQTCEKLLKKIDDQIGWNNFLHKKKHEHLIKQFTLRSQKKSQKFKFKQLYYLNFYIIVSTMLLLIIIVLQPEWLPKDSLFFNIKIIFNKIFPSVPIWIFNCNKRKIRKWDLFGVTLFIYSFFLTQNKNNICNKIS